MNALGIRPHEFDQSTHGQPGKFSLCIAENEEESPWDPLHVERGFARDESTVTVGLVRGTMQVEQRDSKEPEVILETIADSMSYAGTYFPTPRGHAGIVVMGPSTRSSSPRQAGAKRERASTCGSISVGQQACSVTSLRGRCWILHYQTMPLSASRTVRRQFSSSSREHEMRAFQQSARHLLGSK